MPAPVLPTPISDLNDTEFQELDELLAATPEPLEPVDVMMLDGFLCGVLVQPKLHPLEDWMPFVFDFDGQDLPEDVDADWLERTRSLVIRRHAAIARSLIDDGWFDPLILEADPEAEAEAEVVDADAMASDPGYAALGPVSQAMLPWVAGFQHATACFPELVEMPDEDVMLALARVFRHLPAETDDERELHATFAAEQPLDSLDEAIEELVATVADLEQLTRDTRFHVDNVRRETPKVGRNDPCHCGSGKKFKNCHGAPGAAET